MSNKVNIKKSAQVLGEAAAAYIALRDRATNPDGTFDRGGRFYLDAHHACCAGIRTPSRAFPFSEMTHGRTIKHVAAAFEIDTTLLRRAVKTADSVLNT